MRVAIDATPLTLSSGGLARYTSELSTALAREFSDDNFTLVSDQPFAMPSPLPNLQRAGRPRTFLEKRWWSWGLNRELARQGADLFHGTDFAVPYVPVRPSVLTLLDLSPWMEAGWHSGAGRVRRRTPLLIRFQIATLIITLTEAVRNQAISEMRIHPSRIAAIPLAASPHFRPVEPGCRKPYFLYVGTLEPRKNIEGLVAAWRAVRKRAAVELVLAGRSRADFAGLRPETGLHILGEVPDSDLPALYSGAVAFIYPSHYEGFGLPVLEAMQCGACVITSRDPAIGEVAGDAAVRVDDPRQLAEAMITAATRPEWVLVWRERGLRRAGDFSWARTARLTREAYDEALRRFYG